MTEGCFRVLFFFGQGVFIWELTGWKKTLTKDLICPSSSDFKPLQCWLLKTLHRLFGCRGWEKCAFAAFFARKEVHFLKRKVQLFRLHPEILKECLCWKKTRSGRGTSNSKHMERRVTAWGMIKLKLFFWFFFFSLFRRDEMSPWCCVQVQRARRAFVSVMPFSCGDVTFAVWQKVKKEEKKQTKKNPQKPANFPLLPSCSRRVARQTKRSVINCQRWEMKTSMLLQKKTKKKKNQHASSCILPHAQSHILCLLDMWHFKNATVNDSVLHGGSQKESWIPNTPLIASYSPTTDLHVKLQPLTFLQWVFHDVHIVLLSFFFPFFFFASPATLSSCCFTAVY